MKWFKELFKKNEQIDKVEPVARIEREFEGVLPFLNQTINIYVRDLDESDDVLLADLQSKLEQNANELYVKTVASAIDFLECTGNAFHLIYRPDDEPEESQALLDEWNKGNMDILVNQIDDWITDEQANEIASLVMSLYPNMDSLAVLQLYTAQATLSLGYTKNNFGNVLLAIEDQLQSIPESILDYMQLVSVSVSKCDDIVEWYLGFDCDWEIEHGANWVLRDNTVYSAS